MAHALYVRWSFCIPMDNISFSNRNNIKPLSKALLVLSYVDVLEPYTTLIMVVYSGGRDLYLCVKMFLLFVITFFLINKDI